VTYTTSNNLYTYSFEYEGKSYTISCNKEAAAKGSDEVVTTVSSDNFNSIFTDTLKEQLASELKDKSKGFSNEETLAIINDLVNSFKTSVEFYEQNNLKAATIKEFFDSYNSTLKTYNKLEYKNMLNTSETDYSSNIEQLNILVNKIKSSSLEIIFEKYEETLYETTSFQSGRMKYEIPVSDFFKSLETKDKIAFMLDDYRFSEVITSAIVELSDKYEASILAPYNGSISAFIMDLYNNDFAEFINNFDAEKVIKTIELAISSRKETLDNLYNTVNDLGSYLKAQYGETFGENWDNMYAEVTKNIVGTEDECGIFELKSKNIDVESIAEFVENEVKLKERTQRCYTEGTYLNTQIKAVLGDADIEEHKELIDKMLALDLDMYDDEIVLGLKYCLDNNIEEWQVYSKSEEILGEVEFSYSKIALDDVTEILANEESLTKLQEDLAKKLPFSNEALTIDNFNKMVAESLGINAPSRQADIIGNIIFNNLLFKISGTDNVRLKAQVQIHLMNYSFADIFGGKFSVSIDDVGSDTIPATITFTENIAEAKSNAKRTDSSEVGITQKGGTVNLMPESYYMANFGNPLKGLFNRYQKEDGTKDYEKLYNDLDKLQNIAATVQIWVGPICTGIGAAVGGISSATASGGTFVALGAWEGAKAGAAIGNRISDGAKFTRKALIAAQVSCLITQGIETGAFTSPETAIPLALKIVNKTMTVADWKLWGNKKTKYFSTDKILQELAKKFGVKAVVKEFCSYGASEEVAKQVLLALERLNDRTINSFLKANCQLTAQELLLKLADWIENFNEEENEITPDTEEVDPPQNEPDNRTNVEKKLDTVLAKEEYQDLMNDIPPHVQDFLNDSLNNCANNNSSPAEVVELYKQTCQNYVSAENVDTIEDLAEDVEKTMKSAYRQDTGIYDSNVTQNVSLHFEMEESMSAAINTESGIHNGCITCNASLKATVGDTRVNITIETDSAGNMNMNITSSGKDGKNATAKEFSALKQEINNASNIPYSLKHFMTGAIESQIAAAIRANLLASQAQLPGAVAATPLPDQIELPKFLQQPLVFNADTGLYVTDKEYNEDQQEKYFNKILELANKTCNRQGLVALKMLGFSTESSLSSLTELYDALNSGLLSIHYSGTGSDYKEYGDKAWISVSNEFFRTLEEQYDSAVGGGYDQYGNWYEPDYEAQDFYTHLLWQQESDAEAYADAMQEWIDNGSIGPAPDIDDYIDLAYYETQAYFFELNRSTANMSNW
ncbi:hypothetical protein IJD34_07525, partial [bacterium]|nr:hypothetical protein [bacterium]